MGWKDSKKKKNKFPSSVSLGYTYYRLIIIPMKLVEKSNSENKKKKLKEKLISFFITYNGQNSEFVRLGLGGELGK